jgi:hypothetical protein
MDGELRIVALQFEEDFKDAVFAVAEKNEF